MRIDTSKASSVLSKSRGKSNFDVRKLKALDEKYVVKTSENYMGLSYSDVIITWQRWLLSDNPDQNQYGDILFLRGNLADTRNNSIYWKTSVEITEGMAILVPIVTTHYNLGEVYKGTVINNEYYLRKAVREHVDAAGPFWATIEKKEKDYELFKLVPDLESFRILSMPFELNVSEQSPFLDKMDEPNVPGNYTALVSGYFVLIRDLPASLYTVRFGGYGMNNFYTESFYDIKIMSKKDKQVDPV